MNYQSIKDSQDEQEFAIRWHNEQVSKQITEKVFSSRITVKCPWCGWEDSWPVNDGSAEKALVAHKQRCYLDPRRVEAAAKRELLEHPTPAIHVPCVQVALELDAVITKQRILIAQALEALHRGNLDDAKRILEQV